MIEKLIENWLASAGERQFETPFAEVLAAEGHLIVQGPVHHPFEHGKDILTTAPDGRLHAYQLKGPNLTNLAAFEEIQAQLFALAATAVNHPSVHPARRADQVFLVTNSTLTPPVRGRIEAFNLGNAAVGVPPIGVIEKEQLLGRFVAAHGQFLPQDLSDIRVLLELYYEDPSSPFPVRRFARFLDEVMPLPPATPSRVECQRAIAGAALLTAYASKAWQAAGNHMGAAQAWLTACIAMTRLAEEHNLADAAWVPSYTLAFEQARSSLALLLQEAVDADDLVVADIVDGMVYPHRALMVCGYLGAYLLSERALGNGDRNLRDSVHRLLVRERGYVQVGGESVVPHFFVMAKALEATGEVRQGEGMALSMVASIAHVNQRRSPGALADPYHDIEEVLLNQVGDDSDLGLEQFQGRSYTLRSAVEWVARRLWRRHLAVIWYDVTGVEFCEFKPSTPAAYLSVHDEEGVMLFTHAQRPQAWSQLLFEARGHDLAMLPSRLAAHQELLPYLPLIFPHRFTPLTAFAIDEME